MFRRNRGFSLLELLVIILIIALLIAVAVPSFFSYKLKAQRTKAKQDLDVFVNAINLFEFEEGKSLWQFGREFEGSDADLTDGDVTDTNILSFLVGPYIKKLPADPWGNSYVCDAEVGYVLTRGANAIEDPTDIRDDQDIKVFYGAEDLKIQDAIYVNYANDADRQLDKVYVYFTQTINVDANDIAGSAANANDQISSAAPLTEDDSTATAAGTAAANAAWFETYSSAGVGPVVVTGGADDAGDVLYMDDATDGAVNIGVDDNTNAMDEDTRVIILTLDNEHGATTAAQDNLVQGGYINLSAAGATAIHACDLADATPTDLTAVQNPGFGVRVRAE